MFDADDRFEYVNPYFLALRDYPPALCRACVPLEALLHFNAERGNDGEGNVHTQTAERLADIASAAVRIVEREMADGRILRIRHCRAPAGNLIVTIEDRTDEHRAQAALAASEERHTLVAQATSDGIYDWSVPTTFSMFRTGLVKCLASISA